MCSEKPRDKKPHKRFHKKNYKMRDNKIDFYKKKRFSNKNKIHKVNPNLKDLTCYTCGKKGHTSRFCRFNKKLNELNLDEEIISKIQELYISSETENSSESEEDFQIDELKTSSDESKTINVLTKEQESLLEITKHIEDTKTKEVFIKKY